MFIISTTCFGNILNLHLASVINSCKYPTVLHTFVTGDMSIKIIFIILIKSEAQCKYSKNNIIEIHIHAARLLIALTFIQFCLIIHQIYSMLSHFRRTRNGDLLLYGMEEAEKGIVKSMPGLCEQPSQVKAKQLGL